MNRTTIGKNSHWEQRTTNLNCPGNQGNQYEKINR